MGSSVKDALDYRVFLERKLQLGGEHGFDTAPAPFLFEFQGELVRWSLRKGRAAIFADCGLGKTPMQLAWADAVSRHANGRVLILTPLAVSHQTIREAEKFGIEAKRGEGSARITVTNYERLHHYDPADFCGVVCDESSILKNFDGTTRAAVTEFLRMLPYRLLCTATASPNDYVELGTSSEALGELGYMDMLARFFRNDQNTNNPNRLWAGAGWRFKGHAEEAFWRWVSSWARAMRRPSDLGFDDTGFALPELIEREHLIEPKETRPGMLFNLPAVGLKEQREESRRTLTERCAKAAELASGKDPVVVWCHMNREGDLLEKAIPGAVQVSGADSDEEKEGKFIAFASGEARVLITKPKIGGFGLNWQHCARVIYFPSHSYEQYYQAVRRCWRFGQKRSVTVDVVATEGERGVMENLRRKATAADRMFDALVRHMNAALKIERSSHGSWDRKDVPQWLTA